MSARLTMTFIALALLPMGGAIAQTAPPAPVYGSQLMTPQERLEYRNQMRSMKTQEERNAFRLDHHRKMQERAKEKGVSLPDDPPAGGAGMGPRRDSGMGAGMGGGRGRQ